MGNIQPVLQCQREKELLTVPSAALYAEYIIRCRKTRAIVFTNQCKTIVSLDSNAGIVLHNIEKGRFSNDFRESRESNKISPTRQWTTGKTASLLRQPRSTSRLSLYLTRH
jgi:hypothetical protein